MESIWITGKLFLEINFLRLIHQEIILKEFNVTTCKETEKQSMKQKGRRQVTQVKTDKNQDTIPMPTFATRPLTTTSGITAELHGRAAKPAHIGTAIRQIP